MIFRRTSAGWIPAYVSDIKYNVEDDDIVLTPKDMGRAKQSALEYIRDKHSEHPGIIDLKEQLDALTLMVGGNEYEERLQYEILYMCDAKQSQARKDSLKICHRDPVLEEDGLTFKLKFLKYFIIQWIIFLIFGSILIAYYDNPVLTYHMDDAVPELTETVKTTPVKIPTEKYTTWPPKN